MAVSRVVGARPVRIAAIAALAGHVNHALDHERQAAQGRAADGCDVQRVVVAQAMRKRQAWRCIATD